jgi:hypothetical protein
MLWQAWRAALSFCTFVSDFALPVVAVVVPVVVLAGGVEATLGGAIAVAKVASPA